MVGKKILVVEDEKDLAEPLVAGLRDADFYCEWVDTAKKAIHRLNDHWDLVILDLQLPDLSGEAILTYLRQQPDYPSVLVLTARTNMEDKVTLFRQGCDDYMTKPYSFEELLERARALLRRSQRVLFETVSYKDLVLDLKSFRLKSEGAEILLTPKQTAMLRLFITNAERVVSRKELLQFVWGLREEPETNFLGVHLFNLRKRLSEIKKENWLHTVRGAGYVVSEPGGKPYASQV